MRPICVDTYAYNTIGVAYNIRSQYSKALYYFHKGIKLSEGYPEHIYKSKLVSNLALIYIHLQEWDKALLNIEKAKELYNKSMLHELSVLGILDINTAYIYYNLQDAVLAREYYERAKREIVSSDTIRLKILLLKTLAEVYWVENNLKDALLTAEQCIGDKGIETLPLQKALCLILKAKVDIEYKNNESAIIGLVEAVELLTIIENKVYLNNAYKLLSIVYEEKWHMDLALSYYKLYSKGNERNLFDRRQSEVFHLAEAFNTEQINKNMKLVNTQNELNNLYVEKQQLRTRVVSAIVLLVAFGLFKLVRHNFSISKEKDALVEQSTTDALTGLNNRYYYENVIKMLDENQVFYEEKRFTAAIIDIDHFKIVNDTYGHGVGDKVLIDVASHMQSIITEPDVLVRWGGEEFVCLFITSGNNDCEIRLNRLRVAISQLEIAISDEETLTITVSIGALQNLTIDDVIHRNTQSLRLADQYLYQAKEEGRNKVIIRSHEIELMSKNENK